MGANDPMFVLCLEVPGIGSTPINANFFDSYLRPNGMTDRTPLRQVAGGTASHCANALTNALLPE